MEGPNLGQGMKPGPGIPEPAVQGPKTDDNGWAGLFKGHLTAKGMKLGFVAPEVKEGVKVVKLHQEELDKTAGLWENIGVSVSFTAVQKDFALPS